MTNKVAVLRRVPDGWALMIEHPGNPMLDLRVFAGQDALSNAMVDIAKEIAGTSGLVSASVQVLAQEVGASRPALELVED